MSYGFTCFNCREHCETPHAGAAEAEAFAGALGWVIGHYDGQGWYACGNCASALYDPVSLTEAAGDWGKTELAKAAG